MGSFAPRRWAVTIPESLEPILGLLAISAAMGLGVYAALAASGIAAFFGLLELPALLVGLAAPQVWGSLLGLLAIEWLAGAYRLSDLAWNAVHTLVRPLAAALFVATAVAPDQQAFQWIVALGGFTIALAAHTPILALRTAARTAGPFVNPLLVSALQTLVAAGLTLLALLWPLYAAATAALILLLPLPWLPFVSGASYLAISAATVTLTEAGRTRAWEIGPDRLPRRARPVLEAELNESMESVRWTRVALARVGRRRPFYSGRLLLHGNGPRFLHRRWFRPRVIELGRGPGHADQALLVETLEVEAAEPYALCLTRQAPRGAAILAELDPGRAAGSSEPKPGVDPRKH